MRYLLVVTLLLIAVFIYIEESPAIKTSPTIDISDANPKSQTRKTHPLKPIDINLQNQIYKLQYEVSVMKSRIDRQIEKDLNPTLLDFEIGGRPYTLPIDESLELEKVYKFNKYGEVRLKNKKLYTLLKQASVAKIIKVSAYLVTIDIGENRLIKHGQKFRVYIESLDMHFAIKALHVFDTYSVCVLVNDSVTDISDFVTVNDFVTR